MQMFKSHFKFSKFTHVSNTGQISRYHADAQFTVVLDIFRHVVVDNVLDILEVETLAGDVRSHQDIFLAGSELFYSDAALFLICGGGAKGGQGQYAGPVEALFNK